MPVRSLKQLLSEMRKTRTKIEALTRNMPRIIGNECVKVVKDNFKIEGYDTGIGVRQWAKRSAKTNRAYDRRGSYRGSVYNSSNPLLRQSRNLYNGVKYTIVGRKVKIGVDKLLIPYATRMNEGGRGVPRRQYMPFPNQAPNIKMLRKINGKYVKERDKALNQFRR